MSALAGIEVVVITAALGLAALFIAAAIDTYIVLKDERWWE